MPQIDFNQEHGNHEEWRRKLDQRIREVAGGQMMEGRISKAPPEFEEGFWIHVNDINEAPETTHFKQLQEAGVNLPSPEDLTEDELSLKLWEVIDKLAALRAFLQDTNHLSDRELYTLLWSDILREETKDLTNMEGTNCQIPLLGSGSEEDNRLYLIFYADDDYRRFWQKEFPERALPERRDPPYDRDQYLPKAKYGQSGEAAWDED